MEKGREVIQTYSKGQIIFREGDEGHRMFIVKSGDVEIIKGHGSDDVRLDTIHTQGILGEMVFFGAKKRAATAIAVTDVELISISQQMFDDVLKKVPDWFISILKIEISRLKKTDNRVLSLLHTERKNNTIVL